MSALAKAFESAAATAIDIASTRAEHRHDPASARKRARTTPEFDVFLEAYWVAAEPRWKPSTRRTQGVYRRTTSTARFRIAASTR